MSRVLSLARHLPPFISHVCMSCFVAFEFTQRVGHTARTPGPANTNTAEPHAACGCATSPQTRPWCTRPVHVRFRNTASHTQRARLYEPGSHAAATHLRASATLAPQDRGSPKALRREARHMRASRLGFATSPFPTHHAHRGSYISPHRQPRARARNPVLAHETRIPSPSAPLHDHTLGGAHANDTHA